jgi:hypothetical protein
VYDARSREHQMMTQCFYTTDVVLVVVKSIQNWYRVTVTEGQGRAECSRPHHHLLYSTNFSDLSFVPQFKKHIMQIFNVKFISRFTYSTGSLCFQLDIPYISHSVTKGTFHRTCCSDMQTHIATRDSILEHPFQSADKEGQWI